MSVQSIGIKIFGDVNDLITGLKNGEKSVKDFETKTAESLKDAQKQYKALSGAMADLVAQGKANTDAYRQLESAQRTLGTQIKETGDIVKKHNSDLNEHGGFVGNLKSQYGDLIGIFAGVGLTMGAFKGALSIAEEAINSTAATSNKFKEITTSLTFAHKEFFRTLATGDFSKLLTNMTEAINAGKKYAETMVLIQRNTDAVNIRESEERITLEKLKTAQRNVSLSKEERLKAGKEAVELEKRLLDDEVKIAKQKENLQLSEMMRQTKLGEATIRSYMLEADHNEKRISDAKTYLSMITELDRIENQTGRNNQSGAVDQDRLNRMAELKNAIAATSGETKVYATIVKAMGNYEKEAKENFKEAWIERNKIFQTYESEMRRIHITQGRLEKGIIDEGIREEKKVITEKEKELTVESELKRLQKERYEDGIKLAAKWIEVTKNKIFAPEKPQEGFSSLDKISQKNNENIENDIQLPAYRSMKSNISTEMLGNTKKAMDELKSSVDSVSGAFGGLNSAFGTVAKAGGDLFIKFKEGFTSMAQQVAAIAQAAAAIGSQVLGALSDMYKQNTDEQLAALDEKYSREQDGIKNSYLTEAQKNKELKKLDDQKERDRKKIIRSQAEDQKKIQAMQAMMAGALAVVQMLANPGGLVGVALSITAGAIAMAQVMKIMNAPLPALAKGGLAYGPTMALVGDNPNARIDPEVITPLSKLKNMITGNGGEMVLTARVYGDDLLFISERAQKNRNRVV